ncbi:hypothetical protein E2C01_010918 [Portunus trituberculatus]|uniref:Uncharacterized protein n=1 Tax=Portunus trituberculatus TaxID=210409 RepID=A0A5B7DA60_PORTR|nr:hypothetical protein [Portunus trituberculatus]
MKFFSRLKFLLACSDGLEKSTPRQKQSCSGSDRISLPPLPVAVYISRALWVLWELWCLYITCHGRPMRAAMPVVT